MPDNQDTIIIRRPSVVRMVRAVQAAWNWLAGWWR